MNQSFLTKDMINIKQTEIKEEKRKAKEEGKEDNPKDIFAFFCHKNLLFCHDFFP